MVGGRDEASRMKAAKRHTTAPTLVSVMNPSPLAQVFFPVHTFHKRDPIAAKILNKNEVGQPVTIS